MSLPPVNRLADPSDTACLALREVGVQARYDDELIMSLASLALTASGSEFLPVVHHVLRRRGDGAATLARLFAYSDVVETKTVRDLLGEALLESLLEAGILSAEENDERV